MESFYTGTLKLHKGESFSPSFDSAGMDGSNFIVGIGPIFVSMIAFPIYVLIHKTTKYIFQGQTENARIVRFISNQHYKVIVIKFLEESCLEIGLTAWICI